MIAAFSCEVPVAAAAGAPDLNAIDPGGHAIDRSGQFDFDLASQPLASALNAIGSTTGLELFYDANLVFNHRAPELHGRLTANEALATVLAGSGLTAHSIAASAVTIAPLPGWRDTSQTQPRPDVSPHAAYFAMMQGSFARAFCEQGGMAAIRRAVVRITVTHSGAIGNLQILVPAGQPQPDAATVRILSRIKLDQPSPADLPQPVMMLISPPVSADTACAATGRAETAARASSARQP